jgi:hypothetical protein
VRLLGTVVRATVWLCFAVIVGDAVVLRPID